MQSSLLSRDVGQMDRWIVRWIAAVLNGPIKLAECNLIKLYLVITDELFTP